MSVKTETQITNELVKFEEISSIMLSAPEILTKNEGLNKKAVDKAVSILDTIEGQGMSDELDAEANKWQVNAKIAYDLLKERRSPITQMMTQVAKTFTGLEAPLDPAKADSLYSRIQIHRNTWAKKKAEIKRQKEAEILRKQNVEKERISIKAEIEKQIRNAYYDKLDAFKAYYSNLFNNATLENLKEVKEKIKNVKLDYPKDKFNELPTNVTAIYLDSVDVDRLIGVVKVELFDELTANFYENMEVHRDDLLDKLPSRKKELEKIARASAEQQEELKKKAEERRKLEEAEAKRKADEQRKADEAKVNLNEQMETAGTLFDSAAELAEIKEDTGKVRQGYTITVTEPAGWGAIFLFWFEKEGQTLALDKMEKKTFKQLKTFAEKYAHKHNEKIDNDAVIYEEEFKAVATKG